MPNPVAALAGGQLLGAGLSYKGAKDASKDAANAEAARLAFDEKRYADWKSIYGDLETNLSKYYNNLSPKTFEVRGVEALNKERDAALTKVRETFTQRGIRPDSPLAIATEAQVELATAQQKAEIRATAEDKVAEAKGKFLSIGLGANPANSVSNTLASQASSMRSAATDAAAAAGKAISGAVSSTTSALADYMDDSKLNKSLPSY